MRRDLLNLLKQWPVLRQLRNGGDGTGPEAMSEHTRNLLPLVDHALIAEADRLDLPTVLCQGNLKRVWTSALSISRPEAARRVRAAEAVGPRLSMLGEALQPAAPGRRPTHR